MIRVTEIHLVRVYFSAFALAPDDARHNLTLKTQFKEKIRLEGTYRKLSPFPARYGRGYLHMSL